ncbi:MAG: hypothetical protein ABIT08_10735 [Bacteroidia bacterium]
MKKILLPIVLLISVVLQANSQNKVPSQAPAKVQELIIYMPHVDKLKTLQSVIDMVQVYKDIKPVAFCDDLKCLLVRVMGDHSEKSERLLEDLKLAGFQFDLKNNGTIQQVLNQSHDILTADTYWQ